MASPPPPPDPSDQAPELSPRNQQDEGPIVAATYNTHDRFEFTPKEEQQREKFDRVHSGFSPTTNQGAYPPQYQYQHSLVEQQPPLLPPGSVVGTTAASEIGQSKRKKRWVGWTIGLVVGVLCALGAGIGIGYAIGKNVSSSSSSSSSSDSNNNNGTNSTTVTSGSSGIASFACSRDETYASPFGASFAQDCYVSYKTNQTSYDNSSIVVKNFAGITVYSFEQCMDQCQQRNLQLNIGNALGERCTAVSYYANLTYSIPAWAGNCFLKNARGIGKNWDTNSNATLTASGYLVRLS